MFDKIKTPHCLCNKKFYPIKAMFNTTNSSVIRPKAVLKTEVTRKTKHTKFFNKWTFFTFWYAHVRMCIRGKEMLVFRENWHTLFLFLLLLRPFWESPLGLITDELDTRKLWPNQLTGFYMMGKLVVKRLINKPSKRRIYIDSIRF